MLWHRCITAEPVVTSSRKSVGPSVPYAFKNKIYIRIVQRVHSAGWRRRKWFDSMKASTDRPLADLTSDGCISQPHLPLLPCCPMASTKNGCSWPCHHVNIAIIITTMVIMTIIRGRHSGFLADNDLPPPRGFYAFCNRHQSWYYLTIGNWGPSFSFIITKIFDKM